MIKKNEIKLTSHFGKNSNLILRKRGCVNSVLGTDHSNYLKNNLSVELTQFNLINSKIHSKTPSRSEFHEIQCTELSVFTS